jgi:hypothetical protein
MCCVENIRCHKLFDSVSRHVQSAAPSQMVESVLGMLARVSEMLVEQLHFPSETLLKLHVCHFHLIDACDPADQRAFGLKEALGLCRLVQACSWIVVSRKAHLSGLGSGESLADLETGLGYFVSPADNNWDRGIMALLKRGRSSLRLPSNRIP